MLFLQESHSFKIVNQGLIIHIDLRIMELLCLNSLVGKVLTSGFDLLYDKFKGGLVVVITLACSYFAVLHVFENIRFINIF